VPDGQPLHGAQPPRVQIKMDTPQRPDGPPMCSLQPNDYYTILTCKTLTLLPGSFLDLCLQFVAGFIRSADPEFYMLTSYSPFLFFRICTIIYWRNGLSQSVQRPHDLRPPPSLGVSLLPLRPSIRRTPLFFP
jgi:hypothetical protein